MSSLNDLFKEQMVEARRTQILLGAAQVFADKGFHKATTKEIAKAADVSEGTIYNYFNSKRELLFALIDLVATQSLKTVVEAHQRDEPHAFLTAIMRDRYQLLHDQGHLMAPILAEIFSDEDLRGEVYEKIVLPISAFVEKYIQTQIEAGVFRPVNPAIVTRAFIGAMMLNTTMKLTAIDERYKSLPAEAMIEELVSLFLRGMMAA